MLSVIGHRWQPSREPSRLLALNLAIDQSHGETSATSRSANPILFGETIEPLPFVYIKDFGIDRCDLTYVGGIASS